MDTTETYKNLSDNASPLEPDYIVERVEWYENPVYIKMCEKAEEIQDLWRNKNLPNVGHEECYVFVRADDIGKRLHPVYNGGMPEFNKAFVWLPRQDQLQEMVLTGESPIFALESICQWAIQAIPFASMEQLWLAFVMRERFGKVWSGSEWLPISQSEA